MPKFFVFTLAVFLGGEPLKSFDRDYETSIVSPASRQRKASRISKPPPLLMCDGARHSQAEFRTAFKDPRALEKQNFVIDLWGLERVEDEEDLRLLVAAARLIPVPSSGEGYYLDPRLSKKTHFARTFTEEFIGQFAKDFHEETQAGKIRLITNAKTGKIRRSIKGRINRLKITGLVRNRPHQAKLVKRLPKGQAASDQNGPKCQSSHLAGTTFDLSIRDLSREEICWIQEYLYQRHEAYKISVIWEEQSGVFHVMVFPYPTFTDHIC